MIECPHCFHSWKKDNGLNPVDPRYEEYDNIYGTMCPKCRKFVPPLVCPKFVTENKVKLELLQEEIREKIRNKIWR